jgi:hypothetical protein
MFFQSLKEAHNLMCNHTNPDEGRIWLGSPYICKDRRRTVSAYKCKSCGIEYWCANGEGANNLSNRIATKEYFMNNAELQKFVST